jgi:hypothetical protein
MYIYAMLCALRTTFLWLARKPPPSPFPKDRHLVVGKLTEGWTDFARKGGNVIWIMGIDASLPGKTTPHLGYQHGMV